MSLSFTIAAGPRQHSHSQVRVPRDSRPYFTVSHSRLLQHGGSGPRIYIPQKQGDPAISPGTGLRMRSYLNGRLYSLTVSMENIYYFRNNDLVSKSLQLPFAYPWTRLTPSDGFCISAETCLTSRFLVTAYMSHYISV
jgi:hypothetical protein